jgi:hypothetical protein
VEKQMTVRELKRELDNYPDNLKVFITDETIGGKINIEFVSDDYVLHSENPYVTLVTNAYQGT